MDNVIQFPSRPAVQPSREETSETASAYALSDVLIAAQVALHIYRDQTAFDTLWKLVAASRSELLIGVPAWQMRTVGRYLPDSKESMEGRIKFYKLTLAR